MKKLILLSALFIVTQIHTSYSQWVNVDFTTNLDVISDIEFLDANTGFIVGVYDIIGNPKSRIYRTVNGGNLWTKVLEISAPANNITLSSMFFTSSTKGFCTGQRNGIYPFLCKTTNGGLTWDTITLPYTVSATNIKFPNSTVGYMAGSNNGMGIYKTIDGGTNWTNISAAASAAMGVRYIADIHFLDAINGFAATKATSLNQASIYKTTDGGLTWTSLFTLSNNINFHNITFVNSLVGFASADMGNVYKTIDGGNTWTSIPISTSANVYGMYFFSNLLGYAASGTGTGFFPGAIYKTINGGTNWTLDNSGGFDVTTTYYALSFAGGKGYACGISGYSKNNNAPLVGIDELNSILSTNLYPNPIKDNLTFEIESNTKEAFTLTIIDVLGKKVKDLTINSKITNIQLSDLKSGIYFYELKNENKIVKTGKIIME